MNEKAEKLQAFRLRFTKSLPGRMQAIADQMPVTRQMSFVSQESCEELLRMVHSMAGTAGTFRCTAVARHAQQLEILLRQAAQQTDEFKRPVLIRNIDRAYQLLTEAVQHESEQVESIANPVNDQTQVPDEDYREYGMVYLVTDDRELDQDIAEYLPQLKFGVISFASIHDLEIALKVKTPDVLLVSNNLIDDREDLYRQISQIVKEAELPLIIVSTNDSWDERLAALRTGAEAFMVLPLNFDDLIDNLDILCDVHSGSYYRILVVDDDALLAERYATLLEDANMTTRIITNPAQILDCMGEFAPDLILMDLYMEQCSGVEAASLIRQNSAYINVPIVYLSTESGIEQQMYALQVGGDDFLHKGISDEHLVQAIKVRARRFHQLNALLDRDSLTGLLNHVNLKQALETEVARANRDNSSLCFVMLDIDRFKSVNDQYGHPCGDRVIKALSRLLAHQLRKTDIVARYGGEEFAIILPVCDSDKAFLVIDNIRKTFSNIEFNCGKQRFFASFSAGIVSYSLQTQPMEIETIIDKADQALYSAKHNGRNQVMVGVL